MKGEVLQVARCSEPAVVTGRRPVQPRKLPQMSLSIWGKMGKILSLDTGSLERRPGDTRQARAVAAVTYQLYKNQALQMGFWQSRGGADDVT